MTRFNRIMKMFIKAKEKLEVLETQLESESKDLRSRLDDVDMEKRATNVALRKLYDIVG